MIEALSGTDENLLMVLKISQQFSFSVFLKFGETFLFGICRSNLNDFEKMRILKRIKMCLVISLSKNLPFETQFPQPRVATEQTSKTHPLLDN